MNLHKYGRRPKQNNLQLNSLCSITWTRHTEQPPKKLAGILLAQMKCMPAKAQVVTFFPVNTDHSINSSAPVSIRTVWETCYSFELNRATTAMPKNGGQGKLSTWQCRWKNSLKPQNKEANRRWIELHHGRFAKHFLNASGLLVLRLEIRCVKQEETSTG